MNAKDLKVVSPVPFHTHPYPYALGAEIRGLDLAKPLDEATVSAIYAEWVKHKVLVFVDQRINDAQQVEFTRRFGPMEEFPMSAVRATTHKEIFRVANVDAQGNHVPTDDKTWKYLKVTQSWHIDSSYRSIPSKGSVYRGIEITRLEGETWFSDLEKAYDHLPAGLRQKVDELKAVHDFEVSRRTVANLTPLTPQEKAAVPPVEHPLVRVHPDTGRKSIFLSPGHTSHIVGLSAGESKALIEELIEFSTQEKYVYRHHWWPGDVMMWDNRSVMHYAQPFNDRILRRVMHRTTLVGDRPASAG